MIDHRDVRRDAALLDRPRQVFCIVISGVAYEPLGPEAKALLRPVDRAPLRAHLGLADGGGCLDIDDHCVLEIDEVVGGIGEEGALAACRSPARGRIGHRQLLGRHLGCAPEGRIVEHGQIPPNGMGGGRVRQINRLINGMLAVYICAHAAAIDCKPLAADQTLVNAARHVVSNSWRSTSLSRKRPLADLGPVLREGRVIGHITFQPKAAEPAMGEVDMHLLTHPPLRPDAHAVADD